MPTKKGPNATDVHVGKRIRMRRLVLNESQTWLADQLGLTFQQIQKYEKGVNRVGASRMQQLAVAMAVPISYFFEGAPGYREVKNGESASIATDFLTTKYGMRISKAFPKIKSEALKRQIVGLIEDVT
jgi:transcriptional regulator with XRE-family HTH domain